MHIPGSETMAADDRAEYRPGYGPPSSAASILVIVLITIALGVMTAQFALSASSYFIITGVLALVLAFALSRNLQFGIISLFYISGFLFGESPGVHSPHSGYSAGLMPSEVFLGFLVVLWLGRMMFVEKFRLVKSELNRPLIALGLVAVASLIMNNVLRGTRELLFHQMMITQVAEVGLLGCSICAFFLTANVLKEKKWINRVYIPVVLFGVYYSAHRLFGLPTEGVMIWGQFFIAASVAIIYSKLLFGNRSRGKSIGFGLILLLLLAGTYSDLSWISGWIAVSGVIMMVSYYRSKVLAFILVAIMLVALFIYPGIYHSVHSESEIGGDFDRFIIWADAARMFMAVNPILGIGPGNYHPYIYYYNTLWFGERTYTTAHSNYVQMAAELGVVGLVVFLWVIIAAIRTGSRAARTSPSELRWLGISAASMVAAMAVASVFGDYLFPSRGNNGIVTFGTTVYTWLVLGAAVAASHLPHEPENAE